MKKIIVKISSNLLNPDNEIDLIEKLSSQIYSLINNGNKVIVVTSGAVMSGLKILNFTKKPDTLPLLQSCASVGQINLMARYKEQFLKYKLTPAQILVSTEDFKNRVRYLNLRNSIDALLSFNGVIPIFNENDSINTDELKFGDNDQLSSLIALMMGIDILIMLTDVDGFFDGDPKTNPNAKLIDNIEIFNNKLLKHATNKTSLYTSGGMRKKIESAGRATKGGITVFIGNGYKISLEKIIKNEEYGTYIRPSEKALSSRQKWLGFGPVDNGIIYIDEGASVALSKKHSSLLASGIIDVKGIFSKGRLVSIYYNDEKIGQGLTNYSSKDIEIIKGKKSSEFNKFLQSYDYDEVIHKDNLILL